MKRTPSLAARALKQLRARRAAGTLAPPPRGERSGEGEGPPPAKPPPREKIEQVQPSFDNYALRILADAPYPTLLNATHLEAGKRFLDGGVRRAVCGVRCAACGVQCRAVVYGVMYAHSERPL
jgi:hypothetical protein